MRGNTNGGNSGGCNVDVSVRNRRNGMLPIFSLIQFDAVDAVFGFLLVGAEMLANGPVDRITRHSL